MPPRKRIRRSSSRQDAEEAEPRSSLTSQTAIFNVKPTSIFLSQIPPHSILAHSTNCFGEWGAGVALAIHDLFPVADQVYSQHCDTFRPSSRQWPNKEGLVGSCLLIPPQDGDQVEGVWIACLFTSYGYGRPSKKKAGKDGKVKIVEQTRRALKELRRIMEALKEGRSEVMVEKGMGGRDLRVLMVKEDVVSVGVDKQEGEVKAGEDDRQGEKAMDVYSPMINAGSFDVKWEDTRATIEEVFEGWRGNWQFLSPPKS